jgi:hypothetical protein
LRDPAVDLALPTPDLAQIPPKCVPRTSIGLVDPELGGDADAVRRLVVSET